MRIIQILFVSCFIFLTFSLAISATYSLLDTKNLNQEPIQIGEVLTYSVKIKGLPAGTQVTKVVEKTTLAGQPVYRFRSERQTGSLLGKLYHFHDQTESYITIDRLYPLKYVKDLEEQKKSTGMLKWISTMARGQHNTPRIRRTRLYTSQLVYRMICRWFTSYVQRS